MISIGGDSSSFSGRETADENRLSGFNGAAWLRSVRFADEDNYRPSDATITQPHLRSDLILETPRLLLPKVTNFISEQKFEGVVFSVDRDDKTFWARLADYTSEYPDEEVEFVFDEVPDDDWFLIVPGALFSWNIGPELRDKQMRRVADIRFRRFFVFSKTAIELASERASALVSLIAESDAYLTNSSSEI